MWRSEAGAHLPFTLLAISRASNPHVLTATKLKDFDARYGHTRPRHGHLFDGYSLAQRCSAACAAHKARPHQRTPAEWVALVEHFVTKTGIHAVHRSAWVTAPDTGARANIGEWLHTKARRKNYLTPSESDQLQAALGRI